MPNTENKQKTRIAFVKFGGLSAGGTEKFLQIIAANLPKDRFAVDYYYCDAAPYIGSDFKHPDTDPYRSRYMQEHGVNLIRFHVDYKDVTSPHHDWIGTDFWEKFDEKNYDIIQTGRNGYPEYPFIKIKKTPMVDSIHILAGVDNQFNISRVIHISRWSAKQWIRKGGDGKRIHIISLPIEMQAKEYGNLRNELGLQGAFIYGMHQRPDNEIFSDIPLKAYKQIEKDDTAFILLGGGDAYKRQAEALGIQNVYFLSPTGSMDTIGKFLNTLDVYAHGRKDGEVNSQAMAEAMFFGLPIASHTSNQSNGHIENIGNAGNVVNTVEEYAEELKRLMHDKEYYDFRSANARNRFKEMYALEDQIAKITAIYEDVMRNPFPHKIRRCAFHLLTRLRRAARNRYTIAVYRRLKLLVNMQRS